MRPTLLAAAAFVAGAIGAGAVLSLAQPAPPPAGTGDVLPRPGMMATGPHGFGAHDGPGHAGGPLERLRNFALVYRQSDRALSPADVQKIAEAFLLWHGNHSWKVTDVATTPDALVAFSIASPDGFAIAKFTMDPHTARVSRIA